MKKLSKIDSRFIVATGASFLSYFIEKDFAGVVNGFLLALGLR
ncbi:hypothetical protein SAMN06297358_3577 [Pedobacter xixiisoli]|uniref:Uncharacterized protein n=1 Tax=Pedobacter xixiisoli TaxID=1476464 RepID=A0A286AD80_9SPHI|nr:hypothetical protein [Pedobacter xixiisoli]SOD19870.1 hypothetical protein SAMN06297358_3577 [Pedobacter xixiisoli]